MDAEELIGGTVIDALGNGWMEVQMPDGRVFNVEPQVGVVRPNRFDSETMTVGELEIREAV